MPCGRARCGQDMGKQVRWCMGEGLRREGLQWMENDGEARGSNGGYGGMAELVTPASQCPSHLR